MSDLDLATTLRRVYQAKVTDSMSERQLVKSMVEELMKLDVFKHMTEKGVKKLIKRFFNRVKKGKEDGSN